MPFLRPQAASSSRLEDDERERTALALAEPNRIDEAVVGHIEDVLWRSMRHQDDAFGPAGALETTLAQRNLGVTSAVRDWCRSHAAAVNLCQHTAVRRLVAVRPERLRVGQAMLRAGAHRCTRSSESGAVCGNYPFE